MALNVADFRAQFPAFADATKYPDAEVSGYFVEAECFLGAYLEGCPCSDRLYYLMTAFLLDINTRIAAGTYTSGQVQSSTVGGVSVTRAIAPVTSAWQEWLSGSPYGMQLWALLRLRAGGGRYVGGSRERFAFRKVGGSFRP